MQSELARTLLSLLPLGPLWFMLVLPLFMSFVAYLAGKKLARPVAILTTLVELVIAVALALAYDTSTLAAPYLDYVSTYTMGALPYHSAIIQLIVGVDGISVVMVVLSSLVVFVAVLSATHIHESEGTFYMLMLLLQTGLTGVFVSLDLMGFFVFWELVLIPMFFVIGKFGEEGCRHAAIKFFIYTHLGSLAMLLGFFALFFAGGYTFDMVALRNTPLAPEVQIGFALAVFLGAGVKLPVWPLHNWLPWAHVKAPTPGSVILAGILLKMGGYAFIRLGVWLNPVAFSRLAIPFAVVAVFTCIYAAFTAMAQTDLKSMVAYTSINHMAWVLLGVAIGTELALQGAVFMMFSHGAIISVLFIVAGQMKYSAGSREIPAIQGLSKRAPRLSALFVLASLAAFGLPGLSGFIAEALVLFGWATLLTISNFMVWIWASLITFAIFITVGYFLWTLNRTVFSESDPTKEVSDAPLRDLVAPVLMMVPVFVLGLWPDLVIVQIQQVIRFIVSSMAGGGVP
ncbi:MAG: NADH-quinone oxidoreductase subunit M [Candidatus Thorarchaeota archaeon]|nr:NADH-quinone oxidoreductase subunit M [Candidatus Thorarchaeota archaeon]